MGLVRMRNSSTSKIIGQGDMNVVTNADYRLLKTDKIHSRSDDELVVY